MRGERLAVRSVLSVTRAYCRMRAVCHQQAKWFVFNALAFLTRKRRAQEVRGECHLEGTDVVEKPVSC